MYTLPSVPDGSTWTVADIVESDHQSLGSSKIATIVLSSVISHKSQSHERIDSFNLSPFDISSSSFISTFCVDFVRSLYFLMKSCCWLRCDTEDYVSHGSNCDTCSCCHLSLLLCNSIFIWHCQKIEDCCYPVRLKNDAACVTTTVFSISMQVLLSVDSLNGMSALSYISGWERCVKHALVAWRRPCVALSTADGEIE